MKYLHIVFISLLMVACASPPTIVPRIEFDHAEFEALPKSGTATVVGRAYIRTGDGQIYVPAQAHIRLNPKTSYSKQWYEVNYLQKRPIADADPRYLAHVRKVQPDGNGLFTFHDVPPGKYYLSAPIYWTEQATDTTGAVRLRRTGAFVCQEITVRRGAVVTADVAIHDFVP